MQKVTSILFSVLILFQSFNLNTEGFIKFQVLLEHADYHKKAYGDSFFEFIVDHYINSDHLELGEHEEHEDLPFKHSQQSCTQGHSVFVLNHFNFTVQQQEFNEIPLNFCYQELHSIFEQIPIFQPPKSA